MTQPEFFGFLLQARTTAHLLHFKTRNYAEHIALEEFYTSLLELTDKLIETTQGTDNLFNIYVNYTHSSEWQSGIDFLNHFDDAVVINKEIFKRDSQTNIIDDILTLTEQTMYKLTYLK